MAERERYVLLGLARARADWFRRVGQWATSAAIPAEFVKCVSAEELRARLQAARPYSAAVLDGQLPAVDRELLADLRDRGVAPIVVDGEQGGRDWMEIGAAATLAPGFGRQALLDALAAHAAAVGTAARDAAVAPAGHESPRAGLADLVAVTGPGGTGASTAAIALAQGLARGEPAGTVLLADLARRAEHAMLHDTRDVVPGLQELVDAHRGRAPDREAVRALAYRIEPRRYDLLLGLRHPRFWATLRPRTFEDALASLRRAYGTLVCDVDADLEGEADAGSLDVEERNLLARAVALRADAIVVVGIPGLKGTFSLVRTIADLLGLGVPPERIQPVVNRAPRSPRQRAEVAASLADLLRGQLSAGTSADLHAPVFLPTRKVDAALRDGVPLPEPLPRALAAACRAVLGAHGQHDAPRAPTATAPERIAPGSLGHLTERPDGGFFADGP